MGLSSLQRATCSEEKGADWKCQALLPLSNTKRCGIDRCLSTHHSSYRHENTSHHLADRSQGQLHVGALLTMKSLSLKLSELGIANYTKVLKFAKGVERRDLKVPV